jgi:uracil-DNA glycosylase
MPAAPSASTPIEAHYRRLMACRRCPQMASPPVSGRPVVSRVLLVGQAPGDKEPKLGRPFAWTAGKTMFRWFHDGCGLDEESFRSRIYMAAVCRCFPGKKPAGGDRVPAPDEIANCAAWLDAELALLKPELVIPVGKLAMGQFGFEGKLDELIGRSFRRERAGVAFDVIPLPHPSGASPWHRMEPGKTLVKEALGLVARHPAWPGAGASK